MQRGDRVLIHAATGGVGLAALQLCQRAGAEVFATAGSPQKRDLLKALGVRHVMDSRSLSFADEVMEYTNGDGVNIVLNSLSGEAILKSISVLSSYGRFIEIGKRDIYENSKLDMRPFRNNLSFFAVDLDRLCAERPDFGRKLFREVMQLFEDQSLHPIPYRVFSISEVSSAFRYMAQAKHIGKVVISFRDKRDKEVVVAPRPPKPFSAREDGTYLITGGLGGFGLATARWLVDRGAKNLVLMGRRGAFTQEAISAVRIMKKAGVNIMVAKADVTRKEHIARVLRDIRRRMPPLRGVIHAAMVLDDGILLQLDKGRMSKVMAPKIIGAWNLHTETLDVPLDFFVLFSSFTSLIGNAGQGNYVAANSFLDALAQYRHANGLPGLSINWGAIGDVGYIAENREVGLMLENIGVKSFTSEKCLRILGELLGHGAVQTGVAHLDWQQLARMSVIKSTPRLSNLVEARLSNDGDGSGAALLDTIMTLVPEERIPFLESFICERLARVLGTSPSKLDVNQPVVGMGIDSLMAVELGNQIENDLGVSVPTVKFLEGLSIAGLSSYVIEKLHSKHDPQAKVTEVVTEVVEEGIQDILEKIEEITEEEAKEMLGQLEDIEDSKSIESREESSL